MEQHSEFCESPKMKEKDRNHIGGTTILKKISKTNEKVTKDFLHHEKTQRKLFIEKRVL